MNLQISFKHVDADQNLKAFIEEKSETLVRYFHGKIKVNWTLSAEKIHRIAHCHLVGNDMDYFGEGNTEDFKASVSVALDRIEKQLRKHKEIVKDHLHHDNKAKTRVPTT